MEATAAFAIRYVVLSDEQLNVQRLCCSDESNVCSCAYPDGLPMLLSMCSMMIACLRRGPHSFHKAGLGFFKETRPEPC